ncbi:MAG: sulfatase [Acidobacteria bacterium]|nr:sulfatase [Acidobacteriota bacterium]
MVSRRDFLSMAAAVAAPEKSPPNIVFLLADDQRWDAMGCAGNRIIQTPNVDRLAARGVRFENNFCTTAICNASRASIFSGLHEKCHRTNIIRQDFTADQYSRTYPALLRKNGYRTGFIGKYGVGAISQVVRKDAFDYTTGNPGPERQGLTRQMGEQALDFLSGCSRKQPFCLSVSFRAPHARDPDPRQYLYEESSAPLYENVTIPVPKTAAPRYFDMMPPFIQKSESRTRWGWRFDTPEKYQQMVKGYYRLITEIDAAVGRIVDGLAKSGFADNTVVIYTSDNGYFLAEHGLADKWYLFEESIRTPLVYFDPRLPARARGKVRGEDTLNIDLAPTILSLAGVKPPVAMQGRDLAPLINGRRVPWRRDWFYSHGYPHPKIPKSEGIRNGRWTYIRWVESEPLLEQLFHIEVDPLEEQSLAGDPAYGRQLNAMQKRWQQWNAALEAWRPDRDWQDPT